MDHSSKETKTEQAIHNNIALCDCIALANDIHPVVIDGVWMSSQSMPPYYPNLITTKPNVDITSHVEHLKDVLSPGWGIKDSFSVLELETSGFRVAVSGGWFSVCSNANRQYTLSVDSNVVVVESAVDFKRWISAWDSAMDGKVFPHDIWRSKDLEFVFVEREKQIVGGFLLNKTIDDIGVSNWFGEFDLINWTLGQMISPSQRAVGYANDQELDELVGFGYEKLHAMKVWIYN